MQRQLAIKLDQPQSYVSKIESGERQLQALELIAICSVIKIEPGALLLNVSLARPTVRHLPPAAGGPESYGVEAGFLTDLMHQLCYPFVPEEGSSGDSPPPTIEPQP